MHIEYKQCPDTKPFQGGCQTSFWANALSHLSLQLSASSCIIACNWWLHFTCSPPLELTEVKQPVKESYKETYSHTDLGSYSVL